ncbi:carboxypeptidase A1-like [Aplysia californica]|uniref:Carboxypeptidase A1-like n=1 Tax=Aplysia californica TaxID=6500 RepID=A0ABM1ABX5_APLCA|nr:carboxypeptidase A1-like [Aplysia californica]
MFHRVVALSVCALFVVFDFSEGQSAEYEGYRLLSFTVTTAEEADFLRSLGKEYPELDFWLDPVPGLRSVALAPPSILRGVESRLSARRLGFKVETSDVQSLVDAESAPVQARKVYTGETIDHERYHSYESMLTSLRELSRKHPGTMSFSDLPHLTHEGRTVAQVKITSPGSTTNKPTIVIEAGIHSREWVSPAANLYFVEKLLRRYDAGDEKATMMLNKFDWIMVPCVNPDGYEHTRNAYQGRFWRKNRRYVRSHCKGIDLNRNFDFEFGSEIELVC